MTTGAGRASLPAARTVSVVAVLRSARPHQWTKNLFVFAGIIFAAEFTDPRQWLPAVAVFFAYCAGSSSAYLLNDVLDAEADRMHPAKRGRPIAAGLLAPRAALGVSAAAALGGLGLALLVGLGSALLFAGFLGIQIAYSALLKHVVLVDVLAIAFLFVLRAAAGAVAVDVELSPWLVVCTGLLALFLGLGKRRGELALAGEATSRPVLDGYSIELVDQLLSIVAAATISAYALYTFTGPPTEAMMLTIPFVVYGLFRYLFLVHRRDLGEEPDRIMLTDIPVLTTVSLWVITASAILLTAD